MRDVRKARNSLMFTFISSVICVGLAACSGSGSTSYGSSASSSAQSVTFAAAASALQKNIISESPHFSNTSVVTAFNFYKYFSKHLGGFFPEAYAADLGMNVIWDPESGSPPATGDFAVINLYNGGGFTCTGSSNTCTNGTTTIPDDESLKNYMGQSLDPNFQNSNGASTTVFGRLQNATSSLCVMAHLLPASSIDTDGLPIVGSLALNFPTDTTNIVYQAVSSGGCGISTANAGAAMSATVSAVSSTDYAKEITIPAQSFVLWLKLVSSTGDFNIMSLEDQRPNGRYAASRAIAHVTGVSTPGAGTVSFEYVSIGSNAAGSTTCYAGGQWTCSFEFHRIFIDEAANASYLVSNTGLPGDAGGGTGAPTTYLQYTAVGKASELKACTSGGTCTGTLALSFTADGQQETNSSTVYASAGNDYDGCINLADRTLANGDSLTCDLTGVSVLAPGGASAMIENTRQVYAADVVATLLANTSDTTTLAFTGASNIFTAPNTR